MYFYGCFLFDNEIEYVKRSIDFRMSNDLSHLWTHMHAFAFRISEREYKFNQLTINYCVLSQIDSKNLN